MTVFADIQRLLDQRLDLIESSPSIAWPNSQTRPGNSALELYIRPTLLLSNTDLYTLNDHQRIPGIYQVDIYTKLNIGVDGVNSLADEIKDHFEAIRKLEINNTIVFIQAVSMKPSIRDESWYRGMVEINFTCFNN